MHHNTWEVIPMSQLPPKTRLLNSKWLFTNKEEKNEVIYKARLVTQGFADLTPYTKEDLYAPVSTIDDVRLLFCLANKFDLPLYQLDVKTAFLNAPLETPVYMRIPEGLNVTESFRKMNACKLKRALYGLKVSPKHWYTKFTSAIEKLNFHPYIFKPCFFQWRQNDKYVFLLLYVDDILLSGNCLPKLENTIERLGHLFQIKSLGAPEKFLGIEITRCLSKGTIFLHQTKFTERLLSKFDITHDTPLDTPMITHEATTKRFKPDHLSESFPDNTRYREAIGGLMYLANGTRPDILFAVNVLSRKQSEPTNSDWLAVRRIFRYLLGTLNYGLLYSGRFDSLHCYVDASLGTNDPNARSTSGYALYLFGDLIGWRTKKQVHVALSSAEAEYVAMSLATRTVIAVNELLKRLLRLKILPVLFEDNRSAMFIAKSHEYQSLKHVVKLSFHYVKFEVLNGNLQIQWIPSDQQIADILTKPLGSLKFHTFCPNLIAPDPTISE